LSFDEQGACGLESADRFAVKRPDAPDRWSADERWGEVSSLRIPVAGSGVHDYGGPFTISVTDPEPTWNAAAQW
jgi:hypothetical protein